MADIKKDEPVTLAPDCTDKYTEKVVLSEEQLELERALQNYVPDTEAEKRLVRKLDWYMMPALWFMYILAYIDRQNIVSPVFTKGMIQPTIEK